jgi:hypothetical protein
LISVSASTLVRRNPLTTLITQLDQRGAVGAEDAQGE